MHSTLFEWKKNSKYIILKLRHLTILLEGFLVYIRISLDSREDDFLRSIISNLKIIGEVVFSCLRKTSVAGCTTIDNDGEYRLKY